VHTICLASERRPSEKRLEGGTGPNRDGAKCEQDGERGTVRRVWAGRRAGARKHPVAVVGEAVRQENELQAGAGQWESSEENSIQNELPGHDSQMRPRTPSGGKVG
jgi:hypothetical protein